MGLTDPSVWPRPQRGERAHMWPGKAQPQPMTLDLGHQPGGCQHSWESVPRFWREKQVLHRRIVPPNLPLSVSNRMALLWLFPTSFPICLFKLTISQWTLQHTPHSGFLVSQPLCSFYLYFVWPFMAPLGNLPLCHPQANLSIPSSVPLLHLEHGASHIFHFKATPISPIGCAAPKD